MTENLRSVLHDIAEDAPPVDVPDTLWRDARRARTRNRLVLVLAAVLLVGTAGALALRWDSAGEAPVVSGRTATLPDHVYEVPHWVVFDDDGDHVGETDLRLGTLAYAFQVGDARPVVVSAEDGSHRVLALPGFDAEPSSPTSPGSLAVSPDGTRLAWAWHEESTPGDATGSLEGGVRLLDTRTGEVTEHQVPGDRVPLVNNFRFSPDGQHLAYQVTVAHEFHENGWTAHIFRAEVLELDTGRRTVLPGRTGDSDAPWAVSDAGAVAAVGHDGRLQLWAPGSTQLATIRDWPTGTGPMPTGSPGWSPGGRLVLTSTGGAQPISYADPPDFRSSPGGVAVPVTRHEGRVPEGGVRVVGVPHDDWILAQDDEGLVLESVTTARRQLSIRVATTDPGLADVQLSVAYALVSPEDLMSSTDRRFPEPDWPMSPVTRLVLWSGTGVVVLVLLTVGLRLWKRGRLRA